jgi:hypothetical protein
MGYPGWQHASLPDKHERSDVPEWFPALRRPRVQQSLLSFHCVSVRRNRRCTHSPNVDEYFNLFSTSLKEASDRPGCKIYLSPSSAAVFWFLLILEVLMKYIPAAVLCLAAVTVSAQSLNPVASCRALGDVHHPVSTSIPRAMEDFSLAPRHSFPDHE